LTHRQPLLRLLEVYALLHGDEAETVARIRDLISQREDCLLRTCAPGHVTASAWIVSHDLSRFLLTHHAKLDRWLQLGGHVDGEPRVHDAALREAREESGMQEFSFFPVPGRDAGEGPMALDLDVHVIPERGEEPEHEHHDIRFLLIAAPAQELVVSSESKDVRWFPFDDLDRVAGDESVARLGRKARTLIHSRR